MRKGTLISVLALSPLLMLVGCAGHHGRRVLGPHEILPQYDYSLPGNDRIPDVAGSYIITLDDADPPTTAYTDDRRLPPSAPAGDTLTIARLPLLPDEALPVAQAGIPNSVSGPPCPVALSNDHTLALVITLDGAAPRKIPVEQGGFLYGTGVVPVDLTDPLFPVVGETLDLAGKGITSVAIGPDNQYAIACCHATKEICVLKLDGPSIVDHQFLSIPIDTKQPLRPTSVTWHPDGQGFALSFAGFRHFALFQFSVNPEDGSYEITPWGDPVPTSPYPYTGRFSADGRYYFTTDLAWSARTAWGLGASVGYISAYSIDPVVAPGAMHKRLSSIAVGRSPVSIAVSPQDNNLVVVGDIEGGMVPDPRVPIASDGGMLHLLRLDENGNFELLTEVRTSVIPEGVTFSADGRHVLVAGYDENIVSIWEIQMIDGAPRLVDTTYGIETGTGPHEVLLIP